MTKLSILFILLLFTLVSCGDDDDRQEVVTKLRGFGSIATPRIIALQDTPASIRSTTLFISPKNINITKTQSYQDNVPLTTQALDIQNDIENDCGPLQIQRFSTNLLVPNTLTPKVLTQYNGVIKIRYGLEALSTNNTEKIVSDLLVVDNTNSALSWNHEKHTVTITPLIQEQLVAETDITIEATTTKATEEDTLKLAWFVSGGKIDNFRAKKTTWTLPAAGSHCLAIALHGRKSRFFAFDFKPLTIN